MDILFAHAAIAHVKDGTAVRKGSAVTRHCGQSELSETDRLRAADVDVNCLETDSSVLAGPKDIAAEQAAKLKATKH